MWLSIHAMHYKAHTRRALRQRLPSDPEAARDFIERDLRDGERRGAALLDARLRERRPPACVVFGFSI